MKNKTLMFGIALVVLMAVSVFAYQMLVVRSHINIVESQTLQYQDASGNWQNFPINTGSVIDLGNANMGVGNSSTFFVKAINPNNRAIMYDLVIDGGYPDLKYAVNCQSGTQYAILDGGNFGEGLSLAVKNEATSESVLGITTIINAGANLTSGYPIMPTTSVSRTEVDNSIAWITCA